MDSMTGLPFALTGLPYGVGSALASSDGAMSGFGGLTETEKEHLILRCKDARSKEEVEKIIDSVTPNDGAAILAEDSSTVFGSWENTGAY